MSWLFALLLAAAEPTATPSRQYAVVLTDGTVTWLTEAPVLRGKSWIGKLSPRGQLVSFPVSSVDAERTRAANERAPAGPTPGAMPFERKTPTPKPVPRKKLKTTRESAEKTLSGLSGETRGGERAGSKSPNVEAGGLREQEAAPVEVPEFVPTDRNGRGEEWWRHRAAGARERLREAERDLAAAQAAADAWDRNPSIWGTEYWARELSRLRVRVERLRLEVADARQRLAELEEEARRAGAWPGWLR